MKRLRVFRSRKWSGDSGAVAVEFAFTFPLLLFLIFVMLDLARLLMFHSGMNVAATEGARAASKSVNRNASYVSTVSKAAMPDSITVMGNPACANSNECLAVILVNTCTTNGLVTVYAQETFQFLAPTAVVFNMFMSGIYTNTGTTDITATATSICQD